MRQVGQRGCGRYGCGRPAAALALGLFASGAAALPTVSLAAADCPASLAQATQLLVVASPGMSSVKATFRRFDRAAVGEAWKEQGAASPAVVGLTGLGVTGLGWPGGDGKAGIGGPRKREGDNRTPAGIFPLGRPFGFAASSAPGYMQLAPGTQVCIDDPASPLYGQIVSRAQAGKTHGEDMGRVDLYRRGFVVDVPVSAARRSGSCIFVHVWRAPTRGTAGCVGLPEVKVAELQASLRPGALIAVLPRAAADRLTACLREPKGAGGPLSGKNPGQN